MFANVNLNNQIVAAQLTSVYNLLRTHSFYSGQKSHSVQSCQRRCHKGNARATADVCCDAASYLIRELQKYELSLPQLSKVLEPCQHIARQEHWDISYVSAASFFENKTGFPDSSLTNYDRVSPPFQHILCQQKVTKLLNSAAKHVLSEQRCGFKARTRYTPTDDSQRTRQPVTAPIADMAVRFDLLKNRKTAQENVVEHGPVLLKTRIKEFDGKPDMQDTIKISFAEGYAAGTGGVDSKSSTVWDFLKACFLKACLGVGVIAGIAIVSFVLTRRTPDLFQSKSFQIDPESVTVKFDDVKGVDEAEQELRDVVEFLRDPEKFTALGAKLPKGVLLVGPPGIGKTLLAKAVAGEAGVPFFYASGAEFDEMFVGTGSRRVKQLFANAKQHAPCVVFLDEIDSVGAKRTNSQLHPYANQTINQLLSEMDGFKSNKGVIVIGATNKKENLDRALLRPGRFDAEVQVFKPDYRGRLDILRLYLAKIKVAAGLDVEKLAHGTTGFTGADIENLVNQAALKAVKDGEEVVNMDHLDFARDKVLMGPAKKKIMDKDAINITACHEAGHTLVALHTQDATPLHKVTIIPRGRSLGHTAFMHEKESHHQTVKQLQAEMDVMMGGRVAEEIVLGIDKITSGASNDLMMATGIATVMVKNYGMSENVGLRVFPAKDIGPLQQDKIDTEIKRILQESYERAKVIIKGHMSEHKAITKALIEFETLDKEEIKLVIKGKKISAKS